MSAATKQRKLSRLAGPRRALVRGLLDSLILYERIETTEAKAKDLAPTFDRLVTKAKKQDLHNYRQILAEVINPVAAQKLNTDLVNGFQSRNSGYTRVIKTGARRGDGAQMAVIELVLDDGYTPKAEKKVEKKTEAPKAKKAKPEEATVVKKTTGKKKEASK
ncbi:50S ribosomal protein L17 [Candidatus Saccharibacteria bacterium]|nr:50S ribosomal protein L17 [Candidatus Saccharibacteria bacterium]